MSVLILPCHAPCLTPGALIRSQQVESLASALTAGREQKIQHGWVRRKEKALSPLDTMLGNSRVLPASPPDALWTDLDAQEKQMLVDLGWDHATWDAGLGP